MIGYLKKIFKDSARKRALSYLRRRYPQYQFGTGTYSTNLEVYSWGEGATLRIGKYCSIADGVQIFLGGEHRVDWVTTYPFSLLWEAGRRFHGHPRSKGDVVIGSDVWIGKEALILSGVTIGDGAVIGARAVVSGNVEPYAIAIGNPARMIKKRFDDETIRRLLETRWWDWTAAEIEKALPLLLSCNVGEFLKSHDIDPSQAGK